MYPAGSALGTSWRRACLLSERGASGNYFCGSVDFVNLWYSARVKFSTGLPSSPGRLSFRIEFGSVDHN